ncbi:hypothetical protein Aab01nite_54450 [Paractinoplanes abujensis]|nr:hypothetical protein Aab01nite_54450 [Actinoplanes abujensis]
MRTHRRDTLARPQPVRPGDPACRTAGQDLSKTYGQVRAVDQVSFSVRDGEVFALPRWQRKATTVLASVELALTATRTQGGLVAGSLRATGRADAVSLVGPAPVRLPVSGADARRAVGWQALPPEYAFPGRASPKDSKHNS